MIDLKRIENYRENNRIEAKKALGGLMKARKVKQDQFGTELIDNEK